MSEYIRQQIALGKTESSTNGALALEGPPRAHRASRKKEEERRLTRDDRLETAPPEAASIDGAALLDEIEALLRRFIVFKEPAAAKVLALWVVHTYAIQAAEFTPYMDANSPEKQSGKSTLLDVLSEIVASPIKTVNISDAALFRVIGKETPTLLFDEVDTIFDKNSDRAELRGILNAGYSRGTPAYRCVGESLTVRAYEVFGPKVLAGIGERPDTIRDRSIPIRLERKKRTEVVDKFRIRFVREQAEAVRVRIAEWAAFHVEALRDADPDPAPGVESPRTQDVTEPLFAIADRAGGTWPQDAREAVRILCTGEESEDDTFGVSLLRALKAIFDEVGADKITTDAILAALKRDENAPPLDVNRYGQAVNAAHRLGQALKRYRIKSKTIRVGEDTAKGFQRKQFEDAWDRYVTVPPAKSPTHRNNGVDTGFLDHLPPEAAEAQNDGKSPSNKDCYDVTELNAKIGDTRVVDDPGDDPEWSGIEGLQPVDSPASCPRCGGEVCVDDSGQRFCYDPAGCGWEADPEVVLSPARVPTATTVSREAVDAESPTLHPALLPDSPRLPL